MGSETNHESESQIEAGVYNQSMGGLGVCKSVCMSILFAANVCCQCGLMSNKAEKVVRLQTRRRHLSRLVNVDPRGQELPGLMRVCARFSS